MERRPKMNPEEEQHLRVWAEEGPGKETEKHKD